MSRTLTCEDSVVAHLGAHVSARPPLYTVVLDPVNDPLANRYCWIFRGLCYFSSQSIVAWELFVLSESIDGNSGEGPLQAYTQQT